MDQWRTLSKRVFEQRKRELEERDGTKLTEEQKARARLLVWRNKRRKRAMAAWGVKGQ